VAGITSVHHYNQQAYTLMHFPGLSFIFPKIPVENAVTQPYLWICMHGFDQAWSKT
jgi:hypothetical protein